MTTIRALLIWAFCRYTDYRTLGKNGAVRALLGGQA